MNTIIKDSVKGTPAYQPLSRRQIAERLARDIPEGWYVNLGIGAPLQVADYVPAERDVIFQSENGILGMGPAPAPAALNPWLVNASRQHVTLVTGAMCYAVNSDLSGKVTGVSYYGPGGNDETIEAELVILTTFIYDNVRLLMLSKTDKHPNGLANSSGELGKHLMAHIMPNVFATFDDRFINNFMGPSAQKHSLDDFNADNFDHAGLGFIRGAQISVGPVALEGGPIGAVTMNTPPGVPRWGAKWRDFFAKYYARHAAIAAQIEDLPYPHQTIDLDPKVRDAYGLPAPRMTYDWRRPNELKRVAFMAQKMEEIGRATGAAHVWGTPEGNGAPAGHHEGGTRMGSDPKTSVVNRYSQSWDLPNLFVVGSSTFPTMGSGFNPTLTIEALAYLSADAIVNRYRKRPGPLI